MYSTPRQLRRLLRQRRRNLPLRVRQAHAEAVADHLLRPQQLLRAQRIALYLAADGELSCEPLAARLRHLGKRIYLPVLRDPFQPKLWFREHRLGEALIPNRFGIGEPALHPGRQCPPRGLDLILMPLVGFDAQGGRLGMGGGFYDRTLEFRIRCPVWRRPRLIGLAHECQRVPHLPANPWDVPLDAVVTEAGLCWFSGRGSPAPADGLAAGLSPLGAGPSRGNSGLGPATD